MFGLAAVLVTVGCPVPMLARWLTGKPGNVPTEFYYRVTTPIALAMMALVGLSPLVGWARKRSALESENAKWITALAMALVLGLSPGGGLA